MTTSRDEPPLLRLRGITKRFGGLVANDGIDLDLARGEILALLGENGAGKTTLMSILFGHYVADAGTIEVTGADGAAHQLPPGSARAALAAGIGMVHQHFTLAMNHSVLDNVILGTEPLWAWRQDLGAARARLAALIESTGLAVPMDARVGSLSIGEQQRVELLKALYRSAKVLILDEPTAVLTPQQSALLFTTLRRLAQGGLGIVFISHKLEEVMSLAHRVAVLRHGRKVLEVAATGTDKARLAHAMVDRPVELPKALPQPAGAPALELLGVGVAPAAGVEPLVDVDLTVHAGEIVGIAGVSGNGQRSLAGLVAGTLLPDRGSLRLAGAPWPTGGPKALIAEGVGRIPEDRHRQGVVGDMTIWENLALEGYDAPDCRRFGLLDLARFRRRAQALRERYDIRGGGSETPARLLSGGNMQKLILARVLEPGPRLILAAQPTRGLDIGALAEVHRHLLDARARGAAILLISEDLDELMQLADRVAVLYRGKLGPARPRAGLELARLGLEMAGQGPAAADAA
ncbi:MAG TPA: ABC transporter ATP-binding protein [Geminicoccaceae bacterium]|nr:ABC transporter ATP-binding protein [Geminicoccaceae bacterium]